MRLQPLPAEQWDEATQQALAAMRGAGEASCGGRHQFACEQFFLLPPEIAHLLAKAGWNVAEVQEFLFRAGSPTASSPDDVNPVLTGGAGVKMTYLPLWAGGTLSVTSGLVQP